MKGIKVKYYILENKLLCLSGQICSPPGISSYSASSTDPVHIGV